MKSYIDRCCYYDVELVCGICQDLLINPHILTCGHVFCLKCIQNSRRVVTNPNCPYRCETAEKEYVFIPCVHNMVQKLDMRCECGELYPLKDESTHRQTCFDSQFDDEEESSDSNWDWETTRRELEDAINPQTPTLAEHIRLTPEHVRNEEVLVQMNDLMNWETMDRVINWSPISDNTRRRIEYLNNIGRYDFRDIE